MYRYIMLPEGTKGGKNMGGLGNRFRESEGCELLLFFLLLVIIFGSCPLFEDSGCELLLFFLLLVILFCGCD
jgi:hypothetical protein